jgi:hypothetical protein
VDYIPIMIVPGNLLVAELSKFKMGLFFVIRIFNIVHQ